MAFDNTSPSQSVLDETPGRTPAGLDSQVG